jgi:DNA-binding response OmpR family regulator
MPHCLVIEDDAETREYLRAGLESAGYTVLALDNGSEGSYQLRERRWDIVVLDRMLPGQVDGIGILSRCARGAPPCACATPGWAWKSVSCSAAGSRNFQSSFI